MYVNLSDLERFDNGTIVTPELLVEQRIIKDTKLGVKVLADGEFTKNLTVYAAKFSGNALARLQGLGGNGLLVGGSAAEADTDSDDAETDATEADAEGSDE